MVLISILVFIAGCRAQPHIVKIGLVAPFEGTYRAIGYDAIYAARMAVREINMAGGINGLYLELVAYDDRGDPEMALTSAENLVIDPDVIAVIGHYRPESSERAAPVYAKAQVSFIVLGEAASVPSPARRLIPSPLTLAEAMTAGAAPEEGETVAIWARPGWAGELKQVLTQKALAGLNVTITDDRGLRQTELVFNLLPPLEATEAIHQAHQTGWRGKTISTLNLLLPSVAQLITGTEEVHIVTAYPLPQDVANSESWIATYQNVGPHVPAPGPYALPTYEAIYLVAEAISTAIAETCPDATTTGRRCAQSPGRTTLGAALNKAHREGALGTITWDAQGFWANAPLYQYHWTDAGFRILHP